MASPQLFLFPTQTQHLEDGLGSSRAKELPFLLSLLCTDTERMYPETVERTLTRVRPAKLHYLSVFSHKNNLIANSFINFLFSGSGTPLFNSV